MAYRYVFTPQCKDDLDDLTKRQHPLLMRIVVEVIPRILQDPHTVSERKSGQLKDCYGFVLSASGAALRDERHWRSRRWSKHGSTPGMPTRMPPKRYCSVGQ